ncbi:MAG: alpha/beta hydrolase [Gammaproteobacteria bacterium]|nr:alpha/beta hydrolase [Gammaproteobacteria bacterium]
MEEAEMPDERANPTSHSYFSQRLRLHYLDWGTESAPPMLLIHGTRDHGHNWEWVAQALRTDYHIVAPDLRGHGDSEWAVGGSYSTTEYVYDIAQLIHQTKLAPITIIAHSLGGGLALKYAGIYPENVTKLVVIEGMGGPPSWYRSTQPVHTRMRNWIESMRKLSGRIPRRYTSLEGAYHRMEEVNSHLDPERARHLTIHGANQNEDGTFSWKFDNYTRSMSPFDMPHDDATSLWENIRCPILMISGSEGFGRRVGHDDVLKPFKDARHVVIDDAGHWVHHDQLDEFVKVTRAFLAE